MAIATQFQNMEYLRVQKIKDRQNNKTRPRPTSFNSYLKTRYDPSSGTQWTTFRRSCSPVITSELVDAFLNTQKAFKEKVIDQNRYHNQNSVQFHVLSSEIPNIFNLGGDLAYISKLIQNNDRESLSKHAHTCIELIYSNAISFNLPITTITLVQGTALGGGFEAALSSNILIAEKSSKMSLPEVMFNMFPGMGAYQLLCRRVSSTLAEKIILSGKTYTTEELFEIGVVDILAESGKGEDAVWKYIQRHKRQAHGEWGFRRMMNTVNSPLILEDLIKSADIWVETALNLSPRDLKHMGFVMRAQKREFL